MKHEILSVKQLYQKRNRDMTQVAEYLPSKIKALSSNSSMAKKNHGGSRVEGAGNNTEKKR
jgi:hypothetical protein